MTGNRAAARPPPRHTGAANLHQLPLPRRVKRRNRLVIAPVTAPSRARPSGSARSGPETSPCCAPACRSRLNLIAAEQIQQPRHAHLSAELTRDKYDGLVRSKTPFHGQCASKSAPIATAIRALPGNCSVISPAFSSTRPGLRCCCQTICPIAPTSLQPEATP